LSPTAISTFLGHASRDLLDVPRNLRPSFSLAPARRGADLSSPLARTLTPQPRLVSERTGLGLRWLHRLTPLFGVALFGLALWLLHRELRNYHYADLVRVLKALPNERLWLAVALTAVSYAVLTFYDALGVRYVRRRLSYGRIAMASLVGYGVSMTLGFPLLTGAPLRYRMYSRWGLTAGEIARVIAFYSTTFWLGLLAVGGFGLLLDPPPLPPELGISHVWVRPLGAVLLALLVAYLVLAALGTQLTIRGFRMEMPSLGTAVAQVLSSALDWVIAAAVLWILFPAGSTSYTAFFAVFVVGQSVAHASHVPGGVGVFESIVLIFLSPTVAAPDVLAALLAWRAIYYLLPLLAAVVALAAHELRRLRARVGPEPLAEWFAATGPRVLAATTFAAGVVLLVSGATPLEPQRLAALPLPLAATETAHLLAGVAGAALLLVARGLQMRLAAGWRWSVRLLAAGVVLSLLKGLDYEEAVMLSIALAALLASRSRFHRRAALLDEPFTPAWVVAIGVVMVATVGIGLFATKHVDYAAELLWTMAPAGDAPRFLRASLGAAIVLAAYGIAHRLHPGLPEPRPPTAAELADARRIIALSPRAEANAALLGDKALMFNPQRTAFVMYGVTRRAWVALGDPVGPPGERDELAWRFREEADRRGVSTVFYHASDALIPTSTEMGLPALRLGEEAIVALQPVDGDADRRLGDEAVAPREAFSLEGSARRRRLRRAWSDLRHRGVTAEFVAAEAVPALIPELRAVSDSWLARRHAREKGFSVGRFDPAYLANFPHAVVRAEGRVVAFATLWAGAPGTELAADLVRYSRDAPPGVMEFLFVELMLWAQAQGFREFNLGMAPAEEARGGRTAPGSRLGALVFRHGEHFSSFERLRRYKELFGAEWRPRYLAAPDTVPLPRVITAVAGLIAGTARERGR
jgi:phosphatidylglycerol lysyltransferase